MSLAPYICVTGAVAAIEYYQRAFGAQEVGARVMDPEGRVGHSTLEIAGVNLHLSDEHPEIGVLSPKTLGGCSVGFTLTVPDTDAAHALAVQAGGTSLSAPEDQFYGARSATVEDPFGIRWFLQTQLEELSDEDMQARVGDAYEIVSPADPAV